MTPEEKKEKKRERDRQRRAANLEKVRESRRLRYAANPEKERESTRQRRAANPEKVREWARLWYTANLEKVRESRRQRRAANPEKERERGRRWGAANREKRRDSRLRSIYGITFAEKESLLQQQGGCCAICREALSVEKAHTDHDHVTKRVRGVLCHNCNVQLGISQKFEQRVGADRVLAYLQNPPAETILYRENI